MNDEYPLVHGIPMHLLTGRGLNEAFLDVVEHQRCEGLPVLVRGEGKVVDVPVDQLLPEITAEIAKFERPPFFIDETPA